MLLQVYFSQPDVWSAHTDQTQDWVLEMETEAVKSSFKGLVKHMAQKDPLSWSSGNFIIAIKFIYSNIHVYS